MASKSEADFNSVERIIQYFKPDPEPPQDSTPEITQELEVAKWPSQGSIEVQDLCMRYV
jgi:ATP-binding cassette subfamily C (CFTR/MRP) protein 1